MSFSVFTKYFYFTLFLLIALLSIDARAEPDVLVSEPVNLDINVNNEEADYYDNEAPENPPEETPKEKETERSFFSFIDKSQKFISSGVEALARNMDQFFSDDKDFYSSNGSSLRLREDTVFSERGKKDSESNVSFNLRLPKTEKKLKIFFETSAEADPSDVTTQAESTPAALAAKSDYVAGIQGESGERFGWKYKAILGGHFVPRFEPFMKFKFRREDKFDKWSINWQETPYWYTTFGWGFDSYLEFNRKIANGNLFRSATFAGWRKENDFFTLSHVFTMFHALDKKKAMSYYMGVYGLSEPKIHTTNFLLGLTYRQNIHKDYLFIELAPQVKYEKINNFRAEHTLLFRLEMVFNK